MSHTYYLGADVGGTGVKFVLCDGQGQRLHQGEIATNANNGLETLERLRETACGWLTTHVGGPAQLQAAGLACAGIVDAKRGALGRSPNLPGWQDSDLAALVGQAFGDLPIALVNDVNGALWGEFQEGAGVGCTDLVMLALGTGVGGGVIINGQLVIGAHSGAGEVGHMVLDLDGPECRCGEKGCLESWAGSTAILKRARAVATGQVSDDLGDVQPLSEQVTRLGQDLTTRDLAQLAESGDVVAGAIFAEVGLRLGQAVANLVNVLDPQRVIIGGGVAQAGELILAPCREVVKALVLAREAKKVPLVLAQLGPLAAAVGAAGLARRMEQNP